MNNRNTKTVLIGIQARSTSKRFPGKIFEQIGNKKTLEHVIDKAKSAKDYLERFVKSEDIRVHVAVLYPEGDRKIKDTFRHTNVTFIEGDENDVLSRYIKASLQFDADYTVRLTADCPLMLDFIINKHIRCAIFNKLDYVSNIEPDCRQVADGLDCECLSARAMSWLADNVTEAYDKEHVTSLIRSARPEDLIQGFVSSKLDSTNLKLSLDTVEDLEVIRKYYHQREHKNEVARKIFGRQFIYEL